MSRAEQLVPKTKRDYLAPLATVLLVVPVALTLLIPQPYTLLALGIAGVLAAHAWDRLDQLTSPRRAALADVSAAILRDAVTKFDQAQLEYLRFYLTYEWREIRLKVIRRDGRTCRRCLTVIRRPHDLTVDHIQPRIKYPQLALDLANLQVLCRRCNSSKGARE